MKKHDDQTKLYRLNCNKGVQRTYRFHYVEKKHDGQYYIDFIKCIDFIIIKGARRTDKRTAFFIILLPVDPTDMTRKEVY